MKIEIISGSPRNNSITYRVALMLQKALQQKSSDIEVGILDVRDYDLPLLQDVFMSVEQTPDAFKPLSQRVFDAQAFILVTPEYNGSYTPALKNLLDYFPKQSRKTFGLATASPGALGGIRAAMQLQQLVYALFGIGSPHMLIVPLLEKKIDAEGNLIDPGFAKNIDVFLKEFLWLAEKVAEDNVMA